MLIMRITKEMLIKEKACKSQILLFEKTFPEGAWWPRDMEKASKVRLKVEWAVKKFKLTGKVIQYYDNKRINYIIYYKNGKLHSPNENTPAYKSWYENNKQNEEIYYKEGYRHNPNESTPAYKEWWHSTGKLYKIMYYEEGKLNNPDKNIPAYRTWEKNGQLSHEMWYKKGQMLYEEYFNDLNVLRKCFKKMF